MLFRRSAAQGIMGRRKEFVAIDLQLVTSTDCIRLLSPGASSVCHDSPCRGICIQTNWKEID